MEFGLERVPRSAVNKIQVTSGNVGTHEKTFLPGLQRALLRIPKVFNICLSWLFFSAAFVFGFVGWTSLLCVLHISCYVSFFFFCTMLGNYISRKGLINIANE